MQTLQNLKSVIYKAFATITQTLTAIALKVQLLLKKRVRAITAHATILTHALFYSAFFLYVYVNHGNTVELSSPFVADKHVLLLLLGTLLVPFFSLALLVRYYTYWAGFAVWGLFGAVTGMITTAIRRSSTEVDLLVDTGLFQLERLLSHEQVLAYLQKQAGWAMLSEERRSACIEAGRKFKELSSEFRRQLIDQIEANHLAEQARKAAEALRIAADASKSLWTGGMALLDSPAGLTVLGMILGVTIFALFKAFAGGAAGGGGIYFPPAPLFPPADFEPGSPFWSPEPDSPLSPLSPPPVGLPMPPAPHFVAPAFYPDPKRAYFHEPYAIGDLYGSGAPKRFLPVHAAHAQTDRATGTGLDFQFLPFDLP